MEKNFTKNLLFFLIATPILVCCSGDRLPNTSPVEPLTYRTNPADTFVNTLEPAKSNISGIEKSTVQNNIKYLLDTLDYAQLIKDSYNRQNITTELQEYYKLNNFNLIWSSTDAALPKAQLLLSHLLMVDSQGLSVSDYDVSKLLNYQQRVFDKPYEINLVELIMLDIRLSAAYVSYAWHLANGRTRPSIRRARWMNESENAPVAEILTSHNITEAVDLLTPQLNGYRESIKALELYRAIAHQGGWPIIPEDTRLEKGDESELIPILRKRLAITQDLNVNPEEVACDSMFDDNVESAVKRFQHRHGLLSDGIVGKSTVQAMNVPVDSRISQIMLNLERIRWMPSDIGNRYIYVNVPEFKLYVYEEGQPKLNMRVIVGKQDNATPIFNKSMKYIVFSPKWNVPKSIITKEILPKIQRDSTFLKRNNYTLYERGNTESQPLNPQKIDWNDLDGGSIRVVQKPGSGNALGRVKFLMPNDMNIYLHDTPADYLFQRDKRALSHGCVRLEFPDLLAEYLLKSQGWDIAKIRSKMYDGEPLWVSLKEEIPVYLNYVTSWTDDKGLINFRDDIYGYDYEQLPLMKSESVAGLF